MITHKELLLSLERNLRKDVDKNGKIDIHDVERVINCFLVKLDNDKRESTPIQKFLFVEDGSVDTDELDEIMYLRNPEIKVIVYRQGASRPELVDISEEKKNE